MDDGNVFIHQQSSLSSDSNGEEHAKTEGITSRILSKRICLVGRVNSNELICELSKTFCVPIITSETGEHIQDNKLFSTTFVLEDFNDEIFNKLYIQRESILGSIALRQLAVKKESLPDNTRPLFNLSMMGVVVCFTGFRIKDDLSRLVPLVHHMGGSIRKDMSSKVTHLIANVATGEKYKYASTFRVPVVHQSWVTESWENRQDWEFSATQDDFVTKHKLKPFYGVRVCFIGFQEDEEKHMIEILEANGGILTTIEDSSCSHIVVDESSIGNRIETSSKAFIIKAEWFWTSVQKQLCLDEKDYLYDDYIEQIVSPATKRDSLQTTPSSVSKRKRKRLQETLSSLAHHQPSPTVYKRRSSVSDAGLLSVSGSFLDFSGSLDKTLNEIPEDVIITEVPRKTHTPRHQVFYELLQTERNYFSILDTIMKKFKKHLEDMPEEEALLNNTELRMIFGNLPPIYEVHRKMLDELKWCAFHWTDQLSIGNIILKYSSDLLKAYPPFVNFFEEMKDMLQLCDTNKPRFHAFLKACQTKPECGRQTLQDLLIRPVQRLPSISLLLNDILKHTPKTNVDYEALSKALAALKEVMTHINEDKRKTEGQRVMFDIFNEIDHCPPDLVSSHRSFITKAEVVQLSSSEDLAGRGSHLVLFLFSDQLEVCKKRSKAFNTLKSPNVNGIHQKSGSKPYKHVKLMPLSTIKRVIDIKETEDCQRVFSLVIRCTDEVKEKLFSFVMSDEDADKALFLKILCKQMATNACTADADKFLAFLEPHQLEIDTSDISNGTFSKAFKFANRTRLKVGRALSFNKTPSKLKRAVSSMMSPFGSSTNLTPATQLAQMRLASYSNLTELRDSTNSDDSTPAPPLSVQPMRKMKASSLGVAAIKRL